MKSEEKSKLADELDALPVAVRTYKLPNGHVLCMPSDEFDHLVETFRLLIDWRDECNKTEK